MAGGVVGTLLKAIELSIPVPGSSFNKLVKNQLKQGKSRPKRETLATYISFFGKMLRMPERLLKMYQNRGKLYIPFLKPKTGEVWEKLGKTKALGAGRSASNV
jgi:hypothetical protein